MLAFLTESSKPVITAMGIEHVADRDQDGDDAPRPS